MNSRWTVLLVLVLLVAGAARGEEGQSQAELQQENARLRERIAALEKENQQLKQSAGSTTVAEVPEFSQVVGQIKYTLVETSWRGNEAVFWILAVNGGADRLFYVFNAFVIDENGDSYQRSSVTTGSTSFKLPHQVPVKFGVVFNSLPPNSTHVSLFEAEFEVDAGTVQFRAIPLPYKKGGGGA